MNNTLHTPAPWKHDSTWGLIKYGKTEICALHSGNLANAHLISAAPDLLSALQWFADELPGIIRQYCPEGVPVQVGKAHEAARNAIDKAKGAE